MLRRLIPTIHRAVRASSSTASAKATTETAPESSLATGTPQSPNYPATWTTSQRPRPNHESGARFEQTSVQFQPNPLSAMEMINNEPIRLVHGRKAVCDGGVGPLGHPKIFINLDQPGPHPCGYCGIRFEMAPHHDH